MQRHIDLARAISIQNLYGTRMAAEAMRDAGFSISESLFLLTGRVK